MSNKKAQGTTPAAIVTNSTGQLRTVQNIRTPDRATSRLNDIRASLRLAAFASVNITTSQKQNPERGIFYFLFFIYIFRLR